MWACEKISVNKTFRKNKTNVISANAPKKFIIDKFGNSKMCYNVIGDYFERY